MENKKKFIEKLGEILMMYSRENVTELKYIKEDSREYAEITHLIFKTFLNRCTSTAVSHQQEYTAVTIISENW